MQTAFSLIRAIVLALVIATILMLLINNVYVTGGDKLANMVYTQQAMTVLQTMALTLLLFKPSD